MRRRSFLAALGMAPVSMASAMAAPASPGSDHLLAGKIIPPVPATFSLLRNHDGLVLIDDETGAVLFFVPDEPAETVEELIVTDESRCVRRRSEDALKAP